MKNIHNRQLYSLCEVFVGKRLIDAFPIQNGLFYSHLFQLCFIICHQEGPRKSGSIGIGWNISALGLF
jgi:hypothetical protein